MVIASERVRSERPVKLLSVGSGASPNYFFQNNVIVTLSWNPPPPITSHLYISSAGNEIWNSRYYVNCMMCVYRKKNSLKSRSTMKINIGDHRCFWLATTLMSAVILLDKLLILSCWMIVNCFLLKHGAKQRHLNRHFAGRQNVMWLTPSPPKRQNDVI